MLFSLAEIAMRCSKKPNGNGIMSVILMLTLFSCRPLPLFLRVFSLFFCLITYASSTSRASLVYALTYLRMRKTSKRKSLSLHKTSSPPPNHQKTHFFFFFFFMFMQQTQSDREEEDSRFFFFVFFFIF